MRRLLLFILSAGFFCIMAEAATLQHSETILKGMFGRLYKAENDSSKTVINDSICRQLSTTFDKDSSFTYPFDSLPYMGKVYSTDKKLRIYSWNYIADGGDYSFYTFLQFRGNKAILLSQNRPVYLPDEDKTVGANDWYGALYYAAIPFRYQNEACYILLGWSRYAYDVNFKIIDVLSVANETVTFGKAVFVKNMQPHCRVTLPYSASHSLSLLYDEKQKLFIFNHLHASSDQDEHIPDESFAGYQLAGATFGYKDEVTFEHHEANLPRTKVELNLDYGK